MSSEAILVHAKRFAIKGGQKSMVATTDRSIVSRNPVGAWPTNQANTPIPTLGNRKV
jgi:hypothetical protein